jgi:hypothetical protein
MVNNYVVEMNFKLSKLEYFSKIYPQTKLPDPTLNDSPQNSLDLHVSIAECRKLKINNMENYPVT